MGAFWQSRARDAVLGMAVTGETTVSSTWCSRTTVRFLGLFFGLLMATGRLHAAEVVTYYYTSPEGTVLATTDAAGTVLSTADYRPYGSQVAGAPEQGPGYTGHVNDVDTGLIYMQARYYDPILGRFLSVDPFGSAAGDAFSFARYSYANLNPVANIDPNGKAACPGQKASVCLQADLSPAQAARQGDRTITLSPALGTLVVDNKSMVAVRKGEPQVEKLGFVVVNGDGQATAQRAANATTTQSATKDTASAKVPEGAVAVMHGHIDGRSDGVVSDTKGIGDFGPLMSPGIPNVVVSLGRVGVSELASGNLQFRMIEGSMTPREVRLQQENLNRNIENFLNSSSP
jgi:RHS repeat-associated protein